MSPAGWKLAPGKTWRMKLEQDHPNHGKVLPIPARMRSQWGRGTIVIPRPRDVHALMRTVRKGRLVTSSILRARLAEMAGADVACPLTTGIFITIVANAAEEDRRSGKKRITPYWRTVKDGGKLNDKYPGGVDVHAALLRKEGFEIIPGRGKQPPHVAGFEAKLSLL